MNSQPTLIVAEAGVNHNGTINLGKQLVYIAVESGADAVKFQTFKTENNSTPATPKSTNHIKTAGEDTDQTWFELMKTQEMSENMHMELINHCNK